MVPGYREVRELGTGVGGRVVLATYTETGAYVAIKYLTAALKDDPRFVTRLRREARSLVELDHPNVVRLHEYYEDVLEAAVVMELVDGVALRAILRDHGATSPETALTVFKDVLTGLAAGHALGIVHRDCRPENVLVRADGTGKLSDFGIVAPEGDGPAGDPRHLAPERRSGQPASAEADLYAATCVFLECLTGRAPDRHAVPARHRAEPVPMDEVPEPLRHLVAHGMAANPADRPPTARTFAAELEVAAPAAYGPDWEQRGRRRLAETATLFALSFPLARTATGTDRPAAGTARGRARIFQRPRRRTVAVAGLVAVAAAVALIAADRPSGPLASDDVFTPPRYPAGGAPGGTGRATAAPSRSAGVSGPSRRPAETTAEAPLPSGTAAAPDPPALPRPGASSAAPVRPSGSVPAVPVPVPTTASPGTSRTATAPKPSATASSTPSPASPTTPTLRHEVVGLAVAGIDADGATVALRASTTADVVLTVRFAEGPDEEELRDTAEQTLTLSGREVYIETVPHAFTVPPCGQTLLRRATVTTYPRASDGAHSLVVEARGEPCPEPSASDRDGLTGGSTDEPETGPPEADGTGGSPPDEPVEGEESTRYDTL
ncbi:serine/threonine-protein kinase [Planobispora takensis]|uniref:non-specific serine/threonine protein kinase n=1 Tax=Planobispora takensis TaxID=1367882 RepID=A0A8J3WQS1_9ACTN|nr:serine/threonine-protein kinase [Planobispora takensis]GIH98793.1 hypothetical protein Pta02_08020 [Planobispora takensis]